MPIIELVTLIKAPQLVCFDLSRSIDLHKISTEHTNEEAIDGVRTGLIGLNETVTWRAKHLGFTQTLSTIITELNEPNYFIDEMYKGIFKGFRHEHRFDPEGNYTRMVDVFEYEAPLGVLGRIANLLFLKKYMTKLLITRNDVIKEFAESEKWKEVLSVNFNNLPRDNGGSVLNTAELQKIS